MTLVKGVKWLIALAPVGLSAANKAMSGDLQGAGDTFVQSYTGFSAVDGSFDIQRVKTGYIPLIGAYVFGKVAGRVLR